MALCIPIIAQTLSEAFQEIESANPLADCIELRLDSLVEVQLESIPQLVQACQKPVIATYRKQDPIPWLKVALDAGADFVDVEELSEELPLERCIYSIHLDETPSLETLLKLYNSRKRLKPGLIKIVTQANSFLDNLTLLRFLGKVPSGKTIAFCMGEKGIVSRYFAPTDGSFCTFGALKKGKESAPGQPLATHLKKHLASKGTALYGVIGDPIEHSLSPAIHQAAYDADDLNYLFLPFHVKTKDLHDLLTFARKFPLKGLAVTLPHKEAVIPLLDSIDSEAQAIGAVNTIVNQEGTFKGYNTDIDGGLIPLKKRIQLNGKKAIILGSGGAAKAFIYGLQKEGADVTVLSRTPKKLEGLPCKTDSLDVLKSLISSCDLLIQTTPVGMMPLIKESLIPHTWIHSHLTVFDCVYNPIETQLIKDAKKVGCQTISGIEMFLAQANRQYELFTGQFPPENVMRCAALYQP